MELRVEEKASHLKVVIEKPAHFASPLVLLYLVCGIVIAVYPYSTLFLLLLLHWMEPQSIKESLEVFPLLGVQLGKQVGSGAWQKTFIPRAELGHFILNESVDKCRVVSYLAFVRGCKGDLVLVFPTLMPRLKMIQRVYQEVDRVYTDE